MNRSLLSVRITHIENEFKIAAFLLLQGYFAFFETFIVCADEIKNLAEGDLPIRIAIIAKGIHSFAEFAVIKEENCVKQFHRSG